MDDPFVDRRRPTFGSSIFILETERLILRRQTEAEIGSLAKIWTDPDVTRYMGGPRELEQLQTLVAATAADEYDLWPVVEKSAAVSEERAEGCRS